ncbi:MAG: hypothetical protein COU51_02615 [Parcubacteria group bacterium CG10_big_fil_rev_8_21_14_0_10_36_14]|nr:MAG: hypothetical protein COU51_02615 [Parcubacteria group bacterium CG10_big_fil_rev_8_21_14_0_10_36_14]
MEEATQQKNQEPVKPEEKKVRFNVMPQEFRAISPKAKIPKKFIFAAAGAGILVIAIIIGVVVFNSGKENKIIVETSTEPTETVVEKPQEPTASTSTGLFTPAEEPVQVSPTPEEPIGTLVQGNDSDADGLSDKEEAIFQTDTTRPDTDSDGFLDGNEVFNLYNPAAVAPVGLLESGIAKLYRNATEGYSIFYPSLWSTSSTSNTSMVSFLSGESESINITVVEAPEAITLRSWYISEYPDKDINNLQSYTNKQGYRGLQDTDRLNTYIKEGNKVFIINYSLGVTNKIWYRRLYDMMLNSLKLE